MDTRTTDAASFVSALSRTLSAANGYLVAMLAEASLDDLAPSHGDILLHLFAMQDAGERAGGTTMHDLARAIHRDPSTVTALVRKLADAGYVATAKSAADRRVTEVSLTEKGAGLRGAFDEISQRLAAAQMHGIDPGVFRTTCETLDAIRQNFACARCAGERPQGGEA